jgi:hypothetical protein
MASKRKAFVHIGLDDGSGDFVDGALEVHARALAELGVRRPATSGEEMFRAALEMLRTHREWGYRRSEVEGAWTSIVRRGHSGKDTLVFSQTLLAGARPEQVALLVDALAGFEVHVVVTVQAPGAWTIPGEPRHDLGAVLEVWGAAVKKPERLHVVVAGERKATWKAFGKVVGFGTSSLKVGDVPVAVKPRPPHLALASRADVLRTLGESWVELLAHSEHHVVGDVAALVPDPHAVDEPEVVVGVAEHALNEALVEIERLTRRNESLQVRVDALEKKRKKLKRRLSSVA